ncbi:MAG: DUF362 domain-containing protein [Planctomycetia bacterium]|nr:DUF362 domain-containing protein [Planctomycetia bacterium]
MNRHDFLKSTLLGGVAAVLGGEELQAQSPAPCDMAAVLGGAPDEMLKKALEMMGGISRFVKKGQKVTIKPNIAWNRTPERAGNTNPLLVAELVRLCIQAGASSVTVFDHTCDEWRRCYETSGVEEAARKAGAKVVSGNDERLYREVAIPGGKVLKRAKIHEAILDSDVWFNVPVLKHHGGAQLTISMKNYMGLVWDRRFFHRNDLQQCIADICLLKPRPALNIVDAYRVLKDHGPQGRSDADVVLAKGLFVSPDIIAVDTAALRFFNQIRKMSLESVTHITNGELLGLGTTDLKKVKILREKMSET